MKNINIAVAQFQPRDGDKSYNLSVIEKLTSKAKQLGADIISFHELSVTAYTFLKSLNKNEIFDLAEEIPSGESTTSLMEISAKYDIPVLAGLLEKSNGKIYNSYVCVYGEKLLAYREKSGKDGTVGVESRANQAFFGKR